MFRTRIRELREGAGFRSQQSFADAFGVAQTTVASWEGGKREPGHETTIRLAEFFNVTVDYLLGHDVISTNRIREIRKAHKLTMKQLGEKIGLAESTISQYETGKRQPDLEAQAKMCELFGVPLGYLMGVEEKEKTATPSGDSLSSDDPLTTELKAEIDTMSPDHKELLLAQIRIMKERTAK